jgi:hypothetical protein
MDIDIVMEIDTDMDMVIVCDGTGFKNKLVCAWLGAEKITIRHGDKLSVLERINNQV